MSDDGQQNTGQDGQSQGGQPQSGQPQGGQPQGGQPQGGQPQGGQPQGGQPTGQRRYAEPGLADKLQQPAVVDQFKQTIGEYALVGVGFLLFIGIGGLLQGDPSGIGGAIVAAAFGAGIVAVGLGLGPYLAITNSRSIVQNLSVEENVLYAATFIANTAGYLALGLLVLVGGAIGVSGDLIGELLLPVIGGAFVVGAVGVLTIFYEQLF